MNLRSKFRSSPRASSNKKGHRKSGVPFSINPGKIVDGENPRRDVCGRLPQTPGTCAASSVQVRGAAPPRDTFVYIYVQRCLLFYAGKALILLRFFCFIQNQTKVRFFVNKCIISGCFGATARFGSFFCRHATSFKCSSTLLKCLIQSCAVRG